MTADCSLKPLMTSDSYELCSSGPVQIYYIPGSSDEEKKQAKIAIQSLTGWTPLFCSTAKCFTRVVCQAEVPLFVPNTVDLFVQGKEVNIGVTTCAIIQEEAGSVVEKTENTVEIPQAGVAVMYAVDLSKFDERIEVVITDGMQVFCGGASKITVASGSEVTVRKIQMPSKEPGELSN